MSDVREQLLDAALALIQRRGYHGFSFRDLAAEVGIKSASVHYHFPTKNDLCAALVRRYSASLGAALAAVDASDAGPRERLRRFAGVFLDMSQQRNLCLCGALAADSSELDKATRREVQKALAAGENWLAKTLVDGRKAKVFRFKGAPKAPAHALLPGLQGALLLARVCDDDTGFTTAAHWLEGAVVA